MAVSGVDLTEGLSETCFAEFSVGIASVFTKILLSQVLRFISHPPCLLNDANTLLPGLNSALRSMLWFLLVANNCNRLIC